ncbi:MAG: penicillin-binding transpeptidase domain-containing protein [Thermoleophilaceae bacterium]
MAGVAGTVAAGRWHAPRLVASDPRSAGPPLPEGERDTLAGLMRSVVTSGTGQALAGVAGDPAGKSGTAEFGGGDPPRTHAWFIGFARGRGPARVGAMGFRGDIAVAVLVENGRSGRGDRRTSGSRLFQRSRHLGLVLLFGSVSGETAA